MPVSPHRPVRPRASRVGLVAGLLALLVAGACRSNSSSSTPKISAADAAATVASAYALPDDQRACLEQAFHDHPDAERPLTTDGTANDADLEALGRAEDGCVQVTTLSDAIVSGAAAGFGSITDQQRTCLTTAIAALSDDDRVTLLVGLTVPQSLSDAKATELGRVTNGVLDTCHLTLDTLGTTPATGSP